VGRDVAIPSVHHSDEFVDVTTTYRTHPVETIWRFLFAIVPIWAFGASYPKLLSMPFQAAERSSGLSDTKVRDEVTAGR
jgi:hypothetical protein